MVLGGRVMVVAEMRVVRADPSWEWIALSYVWGADRRDDIEWSWTPSKL